MKTFHLRFFFVFFISLVFASEDEKYSFIFGGSQRLDVGEKWIYRTSHEMSFTIPEVGFIQYLTQNVSTMEFIGIKDEFGIMKATLTDFESDNYVNNIEIMDHYREAMENNPCYLYISGPESGAYGEIDHVESAGPEYDYLQEAFEAAYMNIYPLNLTYPFGSGAIDVSVGDKWGHDYHASKFYVNMGSPPSHSLSKTTWTLKKVKEKRGRKIAIITMQDSLELEVFVAVEFLGERRLIAGQATGTTDITYKWDIDANDLLKMHSVTNLVGDFEMDEKKFPMKIFMRNISKNVK